MHRDRLVAVPAEEMEPIVHLAVIVTSTVVGMMERRVAHQVASSHHMVLVGVDQEIKGHSFTEAFVVVVFCISCCEFHILRHVSSSICVSASYTRRSRASVSHFISLRVYVLKYHSKKLNYITKSELLLSGVDDILRGPTKCDRAPRLTP